MPNVAKKFHSLLHKHKPYKTILFRKFGISLFSWKGGTSPLQPARHPNPKPHNPGTGNPQISTLKMCKRFEARVFRVLG
jgi:hypothetical protein